MVYGVGARSGSDQGAKDVAHHEAAIVKMRSDQQREKEALDRASEDREAQKRVHEGHKDKIQHAEVSYRRGKEMHDHEKQSISPDGMQLKDLERRIGKNKVERMDVQTRKEEIRAKEMAEAQGGQRRRFEKLSAVETKRGSSDVMRDATSDVI